MARLAALSDTTDGATALAAVSPQVQRARGRAELAFKLREVEGAPGPTALSTLFQEGSAKIRLPTPEPGRSPEGVFINTAGGLTGGDRIDFLVGVGRAARAVVTTQAAERIYRAATGEPARVGVRLTVASGARLDWLPQETILFDRSALARTLTVDLAADAAFLAVEAFVFGRAAMGETVRSVALTDSWRVRRDGRLVFADGLRLEGDAEAVLGGPATGSGAAACATILCVAPNAEAHLESARECLSSASGASVWGASAWNGMLVARVLAPGGQALRRAVAAALGALRTEPLPRVWMC